MTREVDGEKMILVYNDSEKAFYLPYWADDSFFEIQHSVGFISMAHWKMIEQFQSLKITNSNMMKFMQGLPTEPSDEREWADIEVWRSLAKQHSSFNNTVAEFDLLIGINENGKSYRRVASLLGLKGIQLVEAAI